MAGRLLELLRECDLEPASLRLEITESAIMDHRDAAISELTKLRAAGVKLHVDDFGTGYSSLSYLHRLPIDAIKIDPSFTQRAATETEAERMVRTIIELGHNLKRAVIAEGIETQQQLDCVRALGCDLGQGFFFSKPLDAPQTTALLASPPWLAAKTS
jgi:EAL domain-containing protein (putative c-di-GMP-specific phosphodiesterase class I)